VKYFVLSLFALLPTAVLAGQDVFFAGRCQRLSTAERSKVESLDRSFTEAAARDAQRELDKRVRAALTEPTRRTPSTSTLLVAVEGWLEKKQLLAAQARHEHDADEADEYCEFLLRRAGIP
jgi:hypothetical protein